MYSRTYLALLSISSVLAAVQTPNATVSFEPNRGQAPRPVEYIARTPGGLIYLTPDSIVFHRTGSDESVYLDILGAGAESTWNPADKLPGTISYFVGRDKSAWAESVPRYRRLERNNVLPGVNLVIHSSDDGNVEYDFLLAPGTDPASVSMRARGAKRVSVDSEGRLVIETPSGGRIVHRKPILHQASPHGERIGVAGGFVIRNSDRIEFEARGWNHALPLTIDPVIEAGQYLGGSGDEKAVSITFPDGSAGNTTSIDFPGAPGRRRGRDIFFQYGDSTRIFGGSGDDEALAGSFGTLAGATDSEDLPIELTGDPRFPSFMTQPEYGGGKSDGFYAIVSSSPTSRPVIAYVGGPGTDRLTAVGPFGWLAGVTDAGIPGFGGSAPLRGGLDWFLVLASTASTAGAWNASDLFGGDGDDIPLAMVPAPGGGWIVGGTTTSSNYIAGATRSGPSDAFVVSLSPGLEGTVRAQLLLGGSGGDGVTASATNQGNIAVAGVASSGFPTLNPFHPRCGGGASDGFFAVLSGDLQVQSATCFGGSGTDQVTAVVPLGNDWLITGWTESPDFPVVKPLQADLSGPRDGFLMRIGRGEPQVELSSYFGGSGRDEILTASWLFPTEYILGGSTDSPNLPFASRPRGGTDAFVATVSDETIWNPTVVGAAGLRVQASTVLGGRAMSREAEVTLTSKDPSMVMLSDGGQSAATLALPPDGSTVQVRSFFIDCLTIGEAALEAFAPGYPSETIPVICAAPGASYRIRGNIGQSGPNHYVLSPLSPVSIEFSLIAVDPRTGAAGGSALPIPGRSLPEVTASSSDPAAGSFDPARLAFDPTGNGTIVFTASADIRESELRFEVAGGGRVLPSPSIRVSGAFGLPRSTTSIEVPVGTQYTYRAALFNAGPEITVTSSDPTRFVVSTAPGVTGSASVTGTPEELRAIYLQGLQPGSGLFLTFSAPGIPPSSISVQTVPRGLELAGGATSIKIEEGSPLGLSVAMRNFSSFDPRLNPDQPGIKGRIESSDPTIATPAEFEVEPGGSLPSVPITVLKTGTVTMSLSAEGFEVNPLLSRVTITIVPRSARIDPIDLGRDMQMFVPVVLPFQTTNPRSVTVTSENPALVTVDGRASTTVTAGFVQNPQISVQAIGGPGETRLLIGGPGVRPSSTAVRVGPVAWAWDSNLVSVEDSASVLLRPQVLDRETLQPLGTRAFRSGAPRLEPPSVSSSDPSVAEVTSAPSPDGTTRLEVRGSGTASLTIRQPAGLPDPASNRVLDVIVPSPKLGVQVNGNAVYHDREASTYFSGLPSWFPARSITFSSSDPGRMLLSAVSGQPGSQSITVPAGTHPFVHGLTPDGSAVLTASVPGLPEARAIIRMHPVSALAIPVINSATPFENGRYRMTSRSEPVQLQVSLTGTAINAVMGRARNGAAPIVARVRGTRPEVGTIEPETVTLGDGSPTYVRFRPLAPGETRITIDLPPGYRAPSFEPTMVVEPPAVSRRDIVLAKSTMSTVQAAFQSYTAPLNTNTTLTITSTDPSRVRLSLDPQSVPAASIQPVILAGTLATSFTIHALGDTGQVPVVISGPGIPESRFNAILTGLVFSLNPQPTSLTTQRGQQQLPLFASIQAASTPSIEVGSITPAPGTLIEAKLTSSDPSIVRVDRAESTYGTAGQQPFLITPLAPGTAILSLDVPGQTVAASSRRRPMTVLRNSLTLQGSRTLGRDMHAFYRLETDGGFRVPAIVKITSSDPSRVLVSNFENALGEAEAGFATDRVPSPGVWVQAVGEPGDVSITATAEGYNPGSIPISIVPSAIVIRAPEQVQLNVGGFPEPPPLALVELNPVDLRPAGEGQIRPETALPVTLSSSDPSVATVTPNQFTWTSTTGRPSIRINPAGPGTAIISVSPLPGQPAASRQRQVAVTVVPQDVTFPAIGLTQGMQVPVPFSLANHVQAPSRDGSIAVSVSAATSMRFSIEPRNNGSSSDGVSFSAGQRTSAPLWFQATGNSGTADVSFSVIGTPNRTRFTYPVRLGRTGISIREPGNVAVTAGSSVNLTVLPISLDAAATLMPTAVAGPQGIRIQTSVTDSSIATVSTTGIPAAEAQGTVTIRGIAPGRVTVTISSGENSVTRDVTVVR